MTEPRLHVCMGCRPQGQSVEEQELALERLQNDLVDRIEIATYPCLSGCRQRGRASFCSANKWSWLLGNVNLADDREALIEFIDTWLGHPDGMLKKAQRPVTLRKKILGRLPPIPRAG